MIGKLCIVPVIRVLGHVQAEVDQEKEFYLQGVDLLTGYTANFGVVQVVEILVVKELGGQHHAASTMGIRKSDAYL